jgi:signal transduction histidine kinase/CheY-like chemotaxis protein
LSLDPSPARSPRADRIRAEQIKSLYRAGPIGVLGAMLGAFLVAGAAVYLGGISPGTAKIWLAILGAVAAGHLLLCRRYWRRDRPDADWHAWARGFTAFALAEGLVWGLAAARLMDAPNLDQQMLAMMCAAALSSGGLAAFGSYLPAFLAFFLPTTLPYALYGVLYGDPLHYAFAAMAVVFVIVLSLLATRANRDLARMLRLHFENLDLVEDLGREKVRTEEASLAKSRFLAAASHDLRQPIHALSMFVEALRARIMDAEARQLLGYVEASVTAMGSLFNALLDISRLDAGVVQPHPWDVPIQPLLERMCRDHAADAALKGIRLVLCPCSAAVHTDPILLEQILRNIISNAIRYTDRGRVLVGCRRGRRLSIQVWDTGRGIPAEEQERVFQEFYQLGNPERDRAKGLGLGLAIVKRLTSLLECPLTVSSVPGKGSVFKIAVPLSRGAVNEPASDPDIAAGSRRPGLILVVDDEPTIQAGMRSLLSSWGHTVTASGSCAEVLDEIATLPGIPDLIICDYRLRGGENGIDTIFRLRSEYNEEIPAMLITGDTAPDRLHEAHESGFLLLHKPVAASKLRAAIGNLMSQNPRDEGDPWGRS